MISFGHRIAVVVSVGILSSGCAVDPLDEELTTAPPLTTMGGGTGTPNGLEPSEYLPLQFDLDAALAHALPPPALLNNTPGFHELLGNSAGGKVLKYAIECALPQGMDYSTFTGRGILTTGQGWLSVGLDQQQRTDVRNCITARLNPSGVEVPIWIGGPNVGTSVDSAAYEFSEAVWSVLPTATGWRVNVWPAGTFEQSTNRCKGFTTQVQAEFQTRVCQNSPVACEVSVRTDFATACYNLPLRGFICNGYPAVETRLNKSEWNQMHRTCQQDD